MFYPRHCKGSLTWTCLARNHLRMPCRSLVVMTIAGQPQLSPWKCAAGRTDGNRFNRNWKTISVVSTREEGPRGVPTYGTVNASLGLKIPSIFLIDMGSWRASLSCLLYRPGMITTVLAGPVGRGHATQGLRVQ